MTGPGQDGCFENERGYLFGIAYRMLGSAAEAEDIVQEAWLRWRNRGPAEVASPRAYLARVVTRLCLDHLKSARARREVYVGPWLPEPIATSGPVDVESLSMAFLVLLETLAPVERAAYLLCEVFGYGHAEIAGMLGKSEVACRQIVARARRHIAAGRPRFSADRATHERLLGAFLQATQAGDVDALRGLLAADAVAVTDSGGKALAARRPILGAERVARFFVGLARKAPPATTTAIAEVNGQLALIVRDADSIYAAVLLAGDGARVHRVDVIRNPDKLARLARSLPAA